MSTLHVRLSLAGILFLTMAGQAMAVPREIRRCATINESGSYELARNLDATGDCLVITADFVTIDLAGFTISGDGTGFGISGGRDRKGITLRNGSITHFQDGINFCTGPTPSAGRNNVVERIRSVENAGDGICLNAFDVLAGLIVKDSVASNNGASGLHLGGKAVVTGNIASDNFNGLNISGSATVVGNTMAGNANAGFLTGNHSFDIVNNRIQGLVIGVQVFCPSVVLGNMIGGPTPLLIPPTGGVCTVDHNTLSTF
jgi:hypothetical protein